MRESTLLKKLRSGKTALTFSISCGFNPKGIEFAGRLGYDAVWIDMEHRNFSDAEMELLILACRSADVDAMIRVRKGSYTNFFRPLEAGAAAVMVPHIKTRKEAEDIVYNTKYPPIGRRGFDNAGADGDFAFAPVLEYLDHANRETMVIVQIEDPEALDHLDEIIQVDGVDALFIGPGDMSIAMGVPFQFDHPKMREVWDRVASATEKAGKWWGTVMLSPEQVQRDCAKGARLFNLGSDHGLLMDGMGKRIEQYRSLLGSAV